MSERPKPRRSTRRAMWAVPWRTFSHDQDPHPADIGTAWRMYGAKPGADELRSIGVEPRELVRVYVRIWRKP